MNWLTAITALILFVSQRTFGDASICDNRVLANPKYKSAIEWLRPLQGRFKMGTCEVELHICDPATQDQSDRGTLIGDILIVGENNFENYVPIHFPLTSTSNYQVKISTSRTMFHYEVSDTIKNSITGAREEYLLEILKDWKTAQNGVQITMGTYSSKRDLIHLGDYTYEWSECFK